MSDDKPKIDPVIFDQLVAGPDKVWGLKAIADVLGLSVNTVKRMASRGGPPVYRPAGRYFAYRSELVAWLRRR